MEPNKNEKQIPLNDPLFTARANINTPPPQKMSLHESPMNEILPYPLTPNKNNYPSMISPSPYKNRSNCFSKNSAFKSPNIKGLGNIGNNANRRLFGTEDQEEQEHSGARKPQNFYPDSKIFEERNLAQMPINNGLPPQLFQSSPYSSQIPGIQRNLFANPKLHQYPPQMPPGYPQMSEIPPGMHGRFPPQYGHHPYYGYPPQMHPFDEDAEQIYPSQYYPQHPYGYPPYYPQHPNHFYPMDPSLMHPSYPYGSSSKKGSAQKQNKKLKAQQKEQQKLNGLLQENEQSDSKETGSKKPSPQLQIPEQFQQAPTTKKTRVCNCKKTQCLKLYCDCFAIGELCGSECNCYGCCNAVQFSQKRIDAINQIIEKQPDAFSGKIQQNKDKKLKEHKKGCNCRRSGCQKKYCECYSMGVKCSQYCKCDECKNISGPNDSCHTHGKNAQQQDITQEEELASTKKKLFTSSILGNDSEEKDKPEEDNNNKTENIDLQTIKQREIDFIEKNIEQEIIQEEQKENVLLQTSKKEQKHILSEDICETKTTVKKFPSNNQKASPLQMTTEDDCENMEIKMVTPLQQQKEKQVLILEQQNQEMKEQKQSQGSISTTEDGNINVKIDEVQLKNEEKQNNIEIQEAYIKEKVKQISQNENEQSQQIVQQQQ